MKYPAREDQNLSNMVEKKLLAAARQHTSVDLGIDLNPRIGGNPRLWKLNSLVNGDTVERSVSTTDPGLP